MKHVYFVLLAIAILITPRCVGRTNEARPAVPPSSTQGVTSDLLVISAVYGSGTRFDDVTYRVSDLLHQPNIEFFARPEWLHADPTPGWNKALVIVYEFKKARRIFCTGEGGRVSMDTLLSSPADK